jgi:hypothetical protein
MPITVKELQTAYFQEYENYTEDQLKIAESILEDSYAKLEAKLNQDPSKFAKWQASQRKKEIEAIYNELNSKLVEMSSEYTRQLNLFGISHSLGEMTLLSGEAIYTTPAFVASFAPTVDFSAVLESAKHMDDYMKGNIIQSKALTQNLTSEAVETVNRQIQLGIVEGKGRNQVIANAMKTLDKDKKYLRAAVKRHVHHTGNSIYNKSKNATFNTLAKEDPELYSQWFSNLDSKTTDICRKLYGQVVKVGMQFKALNWKGTEPPAIDPWHHCRSTIIPWKARWKNVTGVKPWSPYKEIQKVIDESA